LEMLYWRFRVALNGENGMIVVGVDGGIGSVLLLYVMWKINLERTILQQLPASPIKRRPSQGEGW
jgi:hypothetical protein